jgi:hypothetical protein
MKLINMFWRSNFLIRVRNWEYWPFMIVYWPVLIYWLWLSFKARSLFFFSASNPGIENGGMLGESKIIILDKLNSELKPVTIFIKSGEDLNSVIKKLDSTNLTYPIICKPDVGERGWKVEKIKTQKEFEDYHSQNTTDYLIQEFLPHPIEMGIFYYRYPDELKGIVSSIVIKEMLTITGDNQSTVKELILNNDRAKLQWKVLKYRYKEILSLVLKPGEVMELVSIGNHARGTKFKDGNFLINDELNDCFDKISKNIDGFFFGRYDIKVNSFDELYEGKLKIMELNGAGAEPGHIYQPGYSLMSAYPVLFHHLKVLFEISVANHKSGIPFLTFKQGLKEYKKSKAVGK